jgi:CheY-like chemotaxis protein
MDVQMPKMDGMAATSAIRKINSKVPIVAMSAHALEREKKRCFEIGMNDYIAKPFKVEALQEIMAKYIKLPSQKEQSGVPRIQHLAHNAVEKKEEPILLSNYTNIKISKELLLLFKEELLKLVDNMQEAFRAKDVRRIQRQMHRIKPNFELFDLANFYQWSDTIDNLALNNASIEAIQVVYDKFEQALPSLIQRINREVE